MILKRLKINTNIPEQTNCYIVMEEKTHEAIVIDPAGETEKIIEMLNVLKAKVRYIYITHCHGDHIGGVEELRKRTNGKVLIHRVDAERII